MNKKIFIIIICIIGLIVGIITWAYFNGDEEVINIPQEITPQEEILDEQLRNTIISLYYINEITGELEIENRMIDAKDLLENPYEELINLWLKGSENENYKTYLSKAVNVNKIEIKENCACIDFTEEFINGYEGKSGEELKVIYCIVNILTELKEVDYVKILINGEENKYLGNINLSEKYCRIEN